MKLTCCLLSAMAMLLLGCWRESEVTISQSNFNNALLAAAENGYWHGCRYELLKQMGRDTSKDTLETVTNALAIHFGMKPTNLKP